MTPKQQAIQNAWIEAIGESEYSKAKRFINQDGWLDDKFNQANLVTVFSLDPNIEEKRISNSTYGYSIHRPKSLSGIDNNNGWIRIEPDGSNLPEKGDYHVIYEDKSQTTIHFNPEDDFDRDLMIGEFTHYQPIVKPEPPIW